MSEKEYIVTLNKGVDYDAFNAEMIASTGAGDIPNRTVDVADARPGSLRNTHYALTDEEAIALRADPRVMDVQIPPQDRDDIGIGFNAVQTSTQWTKSTSAGLTQDLNWGLIRCANPTDIFNETATITGDFNYTLTGKGVDVVIQDSGLQSDHPEFTNYNYNPNNIYNKIIYSIDNYSELSKFCPDDSATHFLIDVVDFFYPTTDFKSNIMIKKAFGFDNTLHFVNTNFLGPPENVEYNLNIVELMMYYFTGELK